jgi:hypothetical protein
VHSGSDQSQRLVRLDVEWVAQVDHLLRLGWHDMDGHKRREGVRGELSGGGFVPRHILKVGVPPNLSVVSPRSCIKLHPRRAFFARARRTCCCPGVVVIVGAVPLRCRHMDSDLERGS